MSCQKGYSESVGQESKKGSESEKEGALRNVNNWEELWTVETEEKVWQMGMNWQERSIFQETWGCPSCKFEGPRVSHLSLFSCHPCMLRGQSINSGWMSNANPWLVGSITGVKTKESRTKKGRGHEFPAGTAKIKERVLGGGTWVVVLTPIWCPWPSPKNHRWWKAGTTLLKWPASFVWNRNSRLQSF